MLRWYWRRGMAVLLGSVGGMLIYSLVTSLAVLTPLTRSWVVLSVLLILSYSCTSAICLAASAIQEGRRVRWSRSTRFGVIIGTLGGAVFYWIGSGFVSHSGGIANHFLLFLLSHPVSGLACLATITVAALLKQVRC